MKPVRPFRIEHAVESWTREEIQQAERVIEPYYVTIGKISSRWSMIEQQVDDAIWQLADVDPEKGACITSQIASVEYRLRSLISLVTLLGGSEELIGKLNTFTRQANSHSAARNRIIHDPILYHEELSCVVVMRLSANKTLRYEVEPISLDYYIQIYRNITTFLDAFILLREEVITAVLTSP